MDRADQQTKQGDASRLVRLRAWAARSMFALWACFSFALAASLMATHTYALPRPGLEDAALRAALLATRDTSAGPRWRMLHVMYSRCRCSQRLLSSLFARGALPDVAERLVLVGAHAEYEQAAHAAGFEVDVITPEQLLIRYGVQAAPLLVVASPEDELRYVGGYTPRKQGLEPQDVAILSALRAGERAEELPLFGCAVSESLRAMLDPLGLKQKSEGVR